MRSLCSYIAFFGIGLIAAIPAPVHADTALQAALAAGKPIIDLRARYEDVQDAGKNIHIGQAETLRARLGYETGLWHGLSALADFDQIWLLGGTYNSTRNGKTAYPIIADPAMTALTELKLIYASDWDTSFVAGRQRIVVGNSRFIGDVGWRQHIQTFDAASAINTAIPDLTLTYAYLYRVNRVFGSDLPIPSNTAGAATGQASYYKSNSHVMNGVFTGIAGLRLEAYAYLLDLSAPGFAVLPAQQPATARLSTATYGLRGDYNVPLASDIALKATGEFAHQTNYATNPLSFGLNYYLEEASLRYRGFGILAGYEVLEGNSVIGLSTPLATLHAFNGWADMFLATPANGLKDFYLQGSYSLPLTAWAMKSLTPSIIYHSYTTDHLSAGIGSEWDAQAELAVNADLSLLAKYANYRGSGLAFGGFPDKSVLWFQVAWKYGA